VLKTALALYMYGDSVSLPLPTFEEVLVCNPATTTEEVSNITLRPYLASFPDLNNFIPEQTVLRSLTKLISQTRLTS